MNDTVFLFDVDNTLLDNDRIIADLRSHLEEVEGVAGAERYWALFSDLRNELGYVDYLGALQRYRDEAREGVARAQRWLLTSSFLFDYPFAGRLYPRALEVLAKLGRIGPTVILTDGDAVYQPRKIQRSGLWDAVDGRVLIYVRKQLHLDAVQTLYPARHYIMVDDKLAILAAMKQSWRGRLTTIFPRQGHYATDPAQLAAAPADMSIAHIGELADLDLQAGR